MHLEIEKIINANFNTSLPFPWNAADVKSAVHNHLIALKHGDTYRWQASVEKIRHSSPKTAHFNLKNRLIQVGDNSCPETLDLQNYFMELRPWRKGPYVIHGCMINCEWRSDFKWQRLKPFVDFKNKTILDIGCNNGYYALRMIGAGASSVLGVDTNLLAFHQYQAITTSVPQLPFWLLTLPFEQLPTNIADFDIVCSMGIIYHRKNPHEHLQSILQRLKSGGQLVLETLTLPNDFPEDSIQPAPHKRYAQMRNVWWIPKISVLIKALQQSGFETITHIMTNQTTPSEQRHTAWMRFHSLPEFLSPSDPQCTIEGYPSPQRTILTARKP